MRRRSRNPPGFVPDAESRIFKDQLAREKDREVRTRLSTLWTVVSLNMIGADVLSSYLPGKQEEVIDFAGGEKNVKYYMLGGAIIYEIPISMIFLSRVVPVNAGRWVNTGSAAFCALTIVGGGSTEPHYVFAASVEILALSYIVYTAFTMPDTEGPVESRHKLGVTADPNRPGMTYSYNF